MLMLVDEEIPYELRKSALMHKDGDRLTLTGAHSQSKKYKWSTDGVCYTASLTSAYPSSDSGLQHMPSSPFAHTLPASVSVLCILTQKDPGSSGWSWVKVGWG